MISISRIDLADFVSPERIVQEIFALNPDLPIPVPIEELAYALDIVSIEPLQSDGFEGGLITDITKSRGFILVKSNTSSERRRFTIAHELAHFLCPWHNPLSGDNFMCSPEDMKFTDAKKAEKHKYMEVEANRFSALLLMPSPQFKKDVRQRKEADLRHIIELGKVYETSKEATARRFVEVHDEPCAVIVSQNGRIQRYYKNREFPNLDVRSGFPVPRGAFTTKGPFPEDLNISEWDEVEGGIWLSDSDRKRLPLLYEQVHYQRDGYRLTLLTLAEDPEDLEEEEDLEESWTPRFRR